MGRRLGLLACNLGIWASTSIERLTLSEDEVVLLNKALEVVRLQLLDIGRSSDGRKEGGADGGVLHFAVVDCGIEVECRSRVCSCPLRWVWGEVEESGEVGFYFKWRPWR
jgi:hypothetical protein